MQDSFNGVINSLETQATIGALAEDMIEQRRKQQEASQALTQESVNVYMSSWALCSPTLARAHASSSVRHWILVPRRTAKPVTEQLLWRTPPSATP